jgi:hypothetical protein
MPITTIIIPPDLSFKDLNLEYETNGDISFDAGVVLRICVASGIDANVFLADEDALCALIAAWYREHRARGGALDPVAEDIDAEVRAENASGQRFSFKAGVA